MRAEDGDFFEKHGFSVTVSLDGIGEVHDALRPFKNGKGSYVCVLKNVQPLLNAQRARLAKRVSANDSNTQLLLDTVQLYKTLGGGWQVFEPVAGPAVRARNS